MKEHKRQRSPQQLSLLVTIGVTSAVAILELLLVNRKYGLFSGGFGQSRVVNLPSEIIAFGLGYGASQALLAISIWWFAVRITRNQAGWPAPLLFAVAMGAGFTLILGLQYQLHSYFSDAVSFALLKQLGGGSLVDALLFGLNEIGVAIVAITVGLLAIWVTWRYLSRRFPVTHGQARSSPKKTFQAMALTFLGLAVIVPRLGDDAAFGLNRTLTWKFVVSALNSATDFDRDGYGLFGLLYDEHPFDPTRHPYSFSLIDDKVDVHGLVYGLSIEHVPPPRIRTVLGRGAPNVVIVVIESARGDAIGKRVDGRAVAPNLEALVASGGAATGSFSHVGFTASSLKSMFTGQLEPKPGDPTLFDDLKSSGYRIGVFSGQPESFGDISATVRMQQNADVYVDAETLKENRAFSFAAKGSLLVDEKFLLEAFDREFGSTEVWKQPVFLYFNFQSPHFPYHHPGIMARTLKDPIPRKEIRKENSDWLNRTYWNAMANADHWLGELVSRLKNIGVWDNTIFFVTGDHGEELFEAGFLGHGHIINRYQFQTFLATNKNKTIPDRDIAISDYRNIILNAARGQVDQQTLRPAFMYIGSLERPTQIGIADTHAGITTFRFDTGEACLDDQARCGAFDSFKGEDRQKIELLVQRWVSELLHGRRVIK